MILFFGLAIVQANAQDSAKQSIKNLIDAKYYVFEPTTITTAKGKLIQLDPGYALQLKGDTLISYLPYFGRAYNAPINSSDAGFDFTSTQFTYSVSAGKKESYIVTIKTKDKTYNADFSLTVYDDGTAYLRANSSDKQPCSYRGNIREK